MRYPVHVILFHLLRVHGWVSQLLDAEEESILKALETFLLLRRGDLKASLTLIHDRLHRKAEFFTIVGKDLNEAISQALFHL